mmetsp:Transcript_1032/g.2848  ORF Transcript_1032/g.2848 Transcript_1032/m.2848 type:complete len:335 (+) Transcript_1032:115-1119(+)|eukprot:CAMPEP_0115833378 /NCGR_PEP_ID=MMETSP0287-20121206/3143_1 /TAXON_ID=412157 /ORGANISM="Chrysochromulina rotalis, Strain UIO044" /LENGTH=334 /DNA_ID=CAMNT_0003286793 /DNA_START=29 /DNA_END=1033 /DNA_ORIENTATION=+
MHIPTTNIRCLLENSRSAEDLLLLPLLLLAAQRGPSTFVELGGFTGEEGSQTWLLEKCYGWNGTIIEASSFNFAAMQNAGRTRSRMLQSAVCKPSGFIDMLVGDSSSSVSGEASLMTPFFRGRWSGVHKNRTESVPCSPLSTLLGLPQLLPARAGSSTYGAPKPVTFLSLDVEGAEEAVLDTLDGDAEFPFAVVLVEINRLTRQGAGELTKSSKRVLSKLTQAGLKQHPMPRYQGSDNALFALSELGDPRFPADMGAPRYPQAGSPHFPIASNESLVVHARVAKHVDEVVAQLLKRPLSRHALFTKKWMGNAEGLARRATLSVQALKAIGLYSI